MDVVYALMRLRGWAVRYLKPPIVGLGIGDSAVKQRANAYLLVEGNGMLIN